MNGQTNPFRNQCLNGMNDSMPSNAEHVPRSYTKRGCVCVCCKYSNWDSEKDSFFVPFVSLVTRCQTVKCSAPFVWMTCSRMTSNIHEWDDADDEWDNLEAECKTKSLCEWHRRQRQWQFVAKFTDDLFGTTLDNLWRLLMSPSCHNSISAKKKTKTWSQKQLINGEYN